MRIRTRKRIGALFAFALLSLSAGPCLAGWEACAPIPKYPAVGFLPGGGWWPITRATRWAYYPPPPGGYTDSDIIAQESYDSPETVRAWFNKTLPDWQFVDHSADEYPRNWQILKPNSNLGVIIFLSSPPIMIQYECA
jgi:hypothetical protein